MAVDGSSCISPTAPLGEILSLQKELSALIIARTSDGLTAVSLHTRKISLLYLNGKTAYAPRQKDTVRATAVIKDTVLNFNFFQSKLYILR